MLPYGPTWLGKDFAFLRFTITECQAGDMHLLMNVGPSGAVQSTDKGSTSVSQGLGSCHASADQSRHLRMSLHHCRAGSLCHSFILIFFIWPFFHAYFTFSVFMFSSAFK